MLLFLNDLCISHLGNYDFPNLESSEAVFFFQVQSPFLYKTLEMIEKISQVTP